MRKLQRLSDIEHSSCGVGFIASLKREFSHDHLTGGLEALKCVEHRGACSADQVTGDGAGVMTDIPFELYGYTRNSVAIATLFAPVNSEQRRKTLAVLEEVFDFFGLRIVEYRKVPTDVSVLGTDARDSLPHIVQAVIERPAHCRTDDSFDKLLYTAKQHTRVKLSDADIKDNFFFASLSATTVVYKALVRAEALDLFYPDLRDPAFKTRFTLFHRRFSTNTRTSWDKVQPFRIIGHNGEINTIPGNRSWSAIRERYLGLRRGELLTREGISDSGSLNEMVEALMHRSSNPHLEDILAIMIPPATRENNFYTFWGRAMEPWDGPAFITYSDGRSVGARLDRSGFRPCRWAMTEDHFYLSSEAGSFEIDERRVIKKGSLHGGTGVRVDINAGSVHFRDPAESKENRNAHFDARLQKLGYVETSDVPPTETQYGVFGYTQEDMKRILLPMITEGKEPIGSMGDTARLAVLSSEPRPCFDYFFQDFAQVTNPPLDYLREETVTDLSNNLGKKPNIFAPKELIPPVHGIELESPVLSLGQMNFIKEAGKKRTNKYGIYYHTIDMTFEREFGAVGFRKAIRTIEQKTREAAADGVSTIILTDENAGPDHLPVPGLIALRTVVNALNATGLRLNVSIIIHSGEVRETHHVAALIGFGATAVCPYLALAVARNQSSGTPDRNEKNLLQAYEAGLLKIMSKSGIAVVKSYQSSKLFTAMGLGKEILEEFFSGMQSAVGGIGIDELVADIIARADRCLENVLLNTYQYKEHNKAEHGERHSMTNERSKLVHKLVREEHTNEEAAALYRTYVETGTRDAPVNVRHLFRLRKADTQLTLDKVQPVQSIWKTFSSGAMSFGAISAESQRDIFLAMQHIGGKSNSGEGGENPYYYTEGITATVKQVASGRFGVTAQYLISGEEVQIKIAQGAKPGEGGQLMGVKVTPDIAHARHSNPGVDLISPPPLHDIYSIEDLKQMIYEFKQLKPGIKVNVKLVAGWNIGTIAVGVAKAGADSIQISGSDGGTGAASLSSMKHTGLPWEIGLVEVHKALLENNLRKNVVLSVDGGLSTGWDIVMAAILGAEEFGFGKLLLVAEGCVMARICEKNTCPTGIATHDPKFKKKYKGTKEHVVTLMRHIAEEVREHLSNLGIKSLHDLIGRTDLIEPNPDFQDVIRTRKLDLSYFFDDMRMDDSRKTNLFNEGINPLNEKIVADTRTAIEKNGSLRLSYTVRNTDRATLATLSGRLARLKHERLVKRIRGADGTPEEYSGSLAIDFIGSAGQGFGVYTVDPLSIRLFGEANDSVCKSMSGGKVVVRPHPDASFKPEENAIIGNCALYGATGGILYVNGRAGDRFAVRNSGGTAVVEGTGLHACEYMTNGLVVILGPAQNNIGAGMTGGKLYLYGGQTQRINGKYITALPLTDDDRNELHSLLADYARETESPLATGILQTWQESQNSFVKYIPVKEARAILERESAEEKHNAA
jgi:glutamate synthase domain-containing protein 2/glutamate synthase domain-containing protein 1/glutamate synthase domain-containing protein 3